ncbi:UNVERIFIED_CONTAM: hypothetical protein DES50_102792 [Williamsia faeni]
MNQPLPGPRPTPGPTPGPRPTPGPVPGAVAPTAAVDPDSIRREVAALLEQADNVAVTGNDTVGDERAGDVVTGGESLIQLAKQAHLLEQAHTVITDALEKVDRV